jgi:beta-galactosidase
LDANGTTVCDFSNEIEFSVNGTAKLISPSKIKAEAGIATALIQLGQNNNDFTVSAKCGMLSTVIDK